MSKEAILYLGAVLVSRIYLFLYHYKVNLLKSDLAKWTEFREMRNLTSHTYDENVALKVSGIVPDFYEEITYLLKELKGIK